MTTTARANPIREGFLLPDDLSVFIGKKTLVKLILEAIEDFDLRTIEGGTGGPGTAGVPSASVLTFLAYCYSTGVYSSTDIEFSMHHDRMMRYLCANNYLTLPALREFRRYNRDRIQSCLATVLRRVWELRFWGEDARPVAMPCYPEASFARWLKVRPPPDFGAEAEQRIEWAVRADSMALDE
jgi:transposase